MDDVVPLPKPTEKILDRVRIRIKPASLLDGLRNSLGRDKLQMSTSLEVMPPAETQTGLPMSTTLEIVNPGETQTNRQSQTGPGSFIGEYPANDGRSK